MFNFTFKKNMKQSTSNLFLIRPYKFFGNPETSINNYFQGDGLGNNNYSINQKALVEFDNFFNVLKNNNINVFLFNDTPYPITPDSIFPNNWISTYQDGKIFIHSMFAKNRRLERRSDIIAFLKENFSFSQIFNDAEFNEKNNNFLEGTGSMVLDRVNQIVYAALSERTCQDLLNEFCKKINFQPIVFTAYLNYNHRKVIYHTNVMMSICENFAIVCFESVASKNEQNKIIDSLDRTKKKIITISLDQVNNFCGNVLEVKNNKDENILIMSSRAFNCFSKNQKKIINSFCKIVHSPLDTIEKYGGGGARCMLAEIFLNKM